MAPSCRKRSSLAEECSGLGPPAVGQEEDEAREAVPLGLGAGQELVDVDLGHVDEVPELSLPEDEPLGVVQAVPVLKPQDPGLGEGGVVDLHLRLALRQVLEGDVGPSGLVIVEGGVALGEGAPEASCPVRRTLCPSTAKVAKARASAVAQSTGRFSSAISRRASRKRLSLGWTWKPQGVWRGAPGGSSGPPWTPGCPPRAPGGRARPRTPARSRKARGAPRVRARPSPGRTRSPAAPGRPPARP